MKLLSWKVGRTLASRITIHLVLTTLVLGICLYYFNLRLLSDFASEQIKESLSASGHEIYDICDINFSWLLRRGLISNEGAVRISKARTIGDIETFMRTKNLGGRIVSADGSELFSHKISPKFHAPPPPGGPEPGGLVALPGGREYYVTSVTFKPWSWRIAIDVDASEFTYLKTAVRHAYLFTGLFLAFSTALLIYFLNQAVKTPVRKIIDDIRAGARPTYRGIEEFSFLSATIGQMMAELQESEQTIRDIATGLGEGVYVVDDGGGLVFMNQEAERLLGWNQAELLGQPIHEVFHRHGRSPEETADICPVLAVIDTGETYRTEEDTFLRSDGTVFPVAYVAAPLKKEGTARGVITVFQDITERKQMENRLKEQLNFLQQLLDTIPIPVYYKSRDGLYLGCNSAFEALIGLTRENVVGKTIYDVAPDDRAAIHHEADLRLLARPGIESYELDGIFRDGEYHDVVSNKATFLDSEGRVAGFVGALIDITERKKAEQERLASLRFFESMDKVNRAVQGADSPERMMKDLLDAVLAVFDCDRAFLKHPCDPDAKTWTSPMESNKPEYPGVFALGLQMDMDPEMAEALRIVLASDGPVTFGPGSIHKLVGKSRERFGIKSYMSMAVYPKSGSPWEFGVQQCAYGREWTEEEKRLFEAIGRRLTDGLSMLLSYRDLRKNEEFLDKIVEHIPNMICVKDSKTLEFVRFNSAGERLLGYGRQELLGKTDYDIFPRELADSLAAQDRQALDSGHLLNIPRHTILNRNNETRFVHTQKMVIADEAGTPQYLLWITEDITERRQAEESIRKLSQAVEQSPVSIVITDVAGRIEFVNAKFTQITGFSYPEAVGQTPHILKSGETPDETLQKLWKTIRSGGIWRGEFHNRKKNGELFWEHVTIAPVRNGDNVITHFVEVNEDITERKKLEEQLRQAQKMEAVGRLAGGVAHDFNNMLSVILGYCELIISKLKPFDPILTPLKAVQSAANRSADLTRQLLAFSRKQTIAPRVIDLNDQTRTMDRLLTRIIGEDIELKLKLETGLWPVYIDPAQIDQVLANLAVNSRDAMPGGGKLTVGTSNITLDEQYSEIHLGFRPGDFVMLAVSDTGCGMDRETLAHVFEPFFTTKPEGKGTGLGLATVYGIVKQNDGYVNIYSEPHLGTTVKIYLPRYSGQEETDTPAVVKVPSQGGRETVLLVEDDESIRTMAKTMLEGLGYVVLEAGAPGEAILLCEKHAEQIDLLLTDVVMPNMNGKELNSRIRQIKPGMRTLFMSGYTADAIAHLGELENGACFMQKPFTLEDLAKKMRETLG
jgi:PAS domain S-box-containing protein